MKLKTLKDLANPHFFSQEKKGYVMEEDLKTEAVNWVKELKKGYSNGAINYLEATDFIKCFFNITDEDLKGGKNNGK